MNRFLSNATNKIDSKGRVSVPASFRSVLTRLDIQELYAIQDFIFPAITIGGPDLLDRLERTIEGGDPFSVDPNDMSLLIHGGGVFLKMDGEGRLMVTDFIKDYTGITDQVTFVGRSDHFQLWDPVCYEEKRQEALSRRMAGGTSRAGQGETG
ncbi:MAG: division/cell wall cluster transcriptional repressor MraZ [Pseudomonadota bacterium]